LTLLDPPYPEVAGSLAGFADGSSDNTPVVVQSRMEDTHLRLELTSADGGTVVAAMGCAEDSRAYGATFDATFELRLADPLAE